MINEEIIWHGPGWYAPRQEGQHDNQCVVWQSVNVFDCAPGRDDQSLADNLARHKSLGTPQWLETKELYDD